MTYNNIKDFKQYAIDNLQNSRFKPIFTDIWKIFGFNPYYQSSCLINPKTDGPWIIKYIDPIWDDKTLVILHCLDFINQDDQGHWIELDNIAKHYGENANKVAVITWNMDLHLEYNGPCQILYFPGHTYDLVNKFDNPYYDNWQQRFWSTHRPNIWQCLNGTARRHRRWVWDWIHTMPNGYSSFADQQQLIQNTYQEWLVSDRVNDQANFFKLEWLYGSTQLNIVTETQYQETQGIITEKTLFAFAACQVPIVIGHQGIVEQCKRLGFDMFEDIIDTSYDCLPNNQRWSIALENNRSVIEQGIDYHALMPRLIANQNHLTQGLRERLLTMFIDRAADVANCLTT